MKKVLLLWYFGILASPSYAQFITIPDTAFVTWLRNNGLDTCMNGNQLDTTCPAVLTSTSITCSFLPIHDVTGIQYFKNLRLLICEDDSITFLPSLPASLTLINCVGNGLHSLPPLPPGLQSLTCGVNPLGTLPTLPNTLMVLDCLNDSLTSLPALPSSLLTLICESNFLHSLPSLPNRLQWLYCPNNLLDSLPELPNSLTNFSCEDNALTSLPELPDSMNNFDCGNNPTLMCLPALKRIVDLSFVGTEITCLPNYGNVTTSAPPLNTIPLCATGNSNGCSVLTGVNELINNDFSLKFYPNPATNEIYIENPVQGSKFNVYDMTGRIRVFSAVGNEIDISSLAPGMYCLQVQTAFGNGFGRFIKE